MHIILKDVLKAVIAATLVVFIPKFADKNSYLSGIIGVMPMVSLTGFVFVFIEKGLDKAINYSQGAAFGMIPAALLYIGICIGLRYGFDLFASLGIGAGAWLLCTLIHQYCSHV